VKRYIIFPVLLMGLGAYGVAYAKEIKPDAVDQEQARALVDRALSMSINTAEGMEQELREQIDLGRLAASLQQDIDIAGQLQELVNRLDALRSHAHSIDSILGGIHGTERLRIILEHMQAPKPIMMDETKETLRLVFLVPGHSAIFEYGEHYHTLALGDALNIVPERYTLTELDESSARLSGANGDSISLELETAHAY
jgi:hypothetical protein